MAMRLPPLTLVSGAGAVDIQELSALLAATRQNCEMLSAEGRLQQCTVDAVKLRRALQHSSVVTAVYARHPIPGDYYMQRELSNERRTWLPSSSTKCLVGFGRATSDHALTASIYDLAVAPSLQRMGIGKQLLRRIVRDLVRMGITDIAVLSTDELRPFFQCCGFASDVLGSTAMGYTRVCKPPPPQFIMTRNK